MKKSVYLPIVLAAYFIFMAVWFGRDLLASGQHLRFWLTAGIEAAVLVGLVFALRRRERLAKERKESGRDR